MSSTSEVRAGERAGPGQRWRSAAIPAAEIEAERETAVVSDEDGSNANAASSDAASRSDWPVPPPCASRPAVTRPRSEDDGLRVRPSWAARLLDTDGDWRANAGRAGIGAALAAAYGVAIGAREGGAAMLVHAAGVPAALIAVALLGLPALYIVLALFDAPLSPDKAIGAAVRGIASAGIVLAGLAPLAALYVVTSGSTEAASLAATFGLILGGALGLRHLVSTLREALAEADSATRFMAGLSQVGFAMFAVLLAWRVWSALLPLVGGA